MKTNTPPKPKVADDMTAEEWDFAWRHRNANLYSVLPHQRPHVLIAREWAKPVRRPTGGPGTGKKGRIATHDEDGWQVHNG